MASSSRGDVKCELFFAAFDGDLRLLKRLVKELNRGNGAAITIANNNDRGRTALHAAAAGGQFYVCKYLIDELKLDVNMKDENGDTPLHHASIKEHLRTTTYLLEKGAHPSTGNGQGLTALHMAAKQGYKKLLRLLISKGAVVDAEAVFGTPLHCAATHDKKEAVKILLTNNANPNKFVQDCFSPLIESILSRSFECVKLLLEAGADVNTDLCGMTPLQVAAFEGETEITKSLLEAGANPNSVINVGPTITLSLAEFSTTLLSLDLSWCQNLSDEALLRLTVDSCLSLRLQSTPQVEGRFIRQRKVGPVRSNANWNGDKRNNFGHQRRRYLPYSSKGQTVQKGFYSKRSPSRSPSPPNDEDEEGYEELKVRYSMERSLVSLSNAWKRKWQIEASFQLLTVPQATYYLLLLRNLAPSEFLVREFHTEFLACGEPKDNIENVVVAVEKVIDFRDWLKGYILEKTCNCFSSEMQEVIRDVLKGLMFLHKNCGGHGNLMKGIGITKFGKAKLMLMEDNSLAYSQRLDKDFKDLAYLLKEILAKHRENKHLTPINPQFSDLVEWLEEEDCWTKKDWIYHHPFIWSLDERIGYPLKLSNFVKKFRLRSLMTEMLSGTSLEDWATKVESWNELRTVLYHSSNTKLDQTLQIHVPINTDDGWAPRFLRNCQEHPTGGRDRYSMEEIYFNKFPCVYVDLHRAMYKAVRAEIKNSNNYSIRAHVFRFFARIL